MRITEFHPGSATAAQLDEYVRVELAAGQQDRQVRSAPTRESAIARLTRTPPPGRRYVHYVARSHPGDPVAGVAVLNLVGDQYADLAAIDVTVHPGYRRHGLGTRLLRELARAAADRKCLLIEGLVEGSAGQAWAEALGFALVQQTVQLSLDLSATDQPRWQPRETAGYRLAEWTGGVPDELLTSYAEARNAIREAPHGEMSFTEPEWTPQRVRGEEATAQARNCELRAVAAIHEPTGQVAGFTYLEVYRARPDLAVLHMLRVNQQVGFIPEAATEIREAELTVLAERLGLNR